MEEVSVDRGQVVAGPPRQAAGPVEELLPRELGAGVAQEVLEDEPDGVVAAPSVQVDLGDRPSVLEMPAPLAALIELLRPLARYHQHEAHGLEHVPEEGGAMVVGNHSLATYDLLLLGLASFEATGRLPTGLADDMLFKVPLLGELVRQIGAEPASPGNGERLLRAGRILYVAPGGMREALRPSEERYEISWTRRRGFARLALHAQVPILLAACPAADEIFTVVDNPVTPLLYQLFKLPLPLFFGRRNLPIPRPVKLVHHLAEPIYPPVRDPLHEDQQVEELHQQALERMKLLIVEARASHG